MAQRSLDNSYPGRNCSAQSKLEKGLSTVAQQETNSVCFSSLKLALGIIECKFITVQLSSLGKESILRQACLQYYSNVRSKCIHKVQKDLATKMWQWRLTSASIFLLFFSYLISILTVSKASSIFFRLVASHSEAIQNKRSDKLTMKSCCISTAACCQTVGS